jgi:uncharacterized protein
MEKKRASSSACPICGRPSEAGLHPFCSRRCADVDLGRWLKGVYKVEANDPDAEIEDVGADGEKSP